MIAVILSLPKKSGFYILAFVWVLSVLFPALVRADETGSLKKGGSPELVLGRLERTDYQIVLPSASPSRQIEVGLREAARLLQSAFAANRIEIPVVLESERDASRPGIFLGATAFAKASGIDLSSLEGYDYIHKAVGSNIVIAGHDAVSVIQEKNPSTRSPKDFDRLATVKAVADFAREHIGARFLYQDMGDQMKDELNLDFLTSPGVEFLPMSRIAVPSQLDKHWKSALAYNIWRNQNSIYFLASNRFPTFNQSLGVHTHEQAVPPEKYFKDHPEYFALVKGVRQNAPQYELANPEFQELVYQYLANLYDQGFDTVYLGHSDGFIRSESKESFDLYGTGNDWSEKLWIFNRNMAERLYKKYPDKTIVLTAYTVTETPPKSFKAFPPNTMLMFTGTNEEDFAKWDGIKIPKGISTYIYTWTPNYCSRYVPMATPESIVRQMKRLHAHQTHGIFTDGMPWYDMGLQGPTAYAFSRFWDDPENADASALTKEFVEAAFGRAALPMMRFYNSLHKGIAIYADYLGTRLPGWMDISDGFQMLSILFPPKLLKELDEHLTEAEKLSNNDRVAARLALVRREYEWLRHTMDVIHLYNAQTVESDNEALRKALLDAIDSRNAFVSGMYGDKEGTRDAKPHPAWNATLFPPVGHDSAHLKLAHGGYRQNFNTTALNWDTAAMRSAPSANLPHALVKSVEAPPTITSQAWEKAAPLALSPVSKSSPQEGDTVARVLFGADALYVRIESPLPGKNGARKNAVEVLLAARGGTDILHRFRLSANGERYEAATGLIVDKMNLLYQREDPDWSEPWKSEVLEQPEANRWLALFVIPYASLGAQKPADNAYWRANFGRTLTTSIGEKEFWLWSGATQLDDHSALGVLDFPSEGAQQQARNMRKQTGMDIPPPKWKSLPDPLPEDSRGEWKFQIDPLEVGVRDDWAATKFDDRAWQKMRVPAWYAETDVGAYNGIAWYRLRFKVPETWKGRDLNILFGAVDKEAWIYLNGKLLREHSEESEGRKAEEIYDTSFEAKAPASLVVFGGENVLTVRVRNTFAGGGISRPVFIHAAPKS